MVPKDDVFIELPNDVQRFWANVWVGNIFGLKILLVFEFRVALPPRLAFLIPQASFNLNFQRILNDRTQRFHKPTVQRIFSKT